MCFVFAFYSPLDILPQRAGFVKAEEELTETQGECKGHRKLIPLSRSILIAYLRI